MAALKAVVLAGPDPAVDGVVRWRIVDLCRWVTERWGARYSETYAAAVVVVGSVTPRDPAPPSAERREGAARLQKDPMGDDGRAPVGFGVQHPTQETANGDLV